MVDKGGLSALPARPPTPPRSSSVSRTEQVRRTSELQCSPPANERPSTSLISPHPLSARSLKRVNFSPLTSYIKAPEFPASLAKNSRPPLRSLRPSKQCKPAKSILKSRPYVESPDEPRSSPTDDLPSMLDYIMQQLEGDCRVSRTDAYMQLLGSLAAYADLPDAAALVEKMPLLTQYIRRDLTITSSAFKHLEISLLHQASSLLCLLLWNPKFAGRISDEFKSFVLDLAIGSLQNPSTPKTIVIDDMRILYVQSFQPKLFTSSRITLLLHTLEDITTRLGGKSIVMMRLGIYEGLLKQARSLMATYACLWIDHVIKAMFHRVKDIRVRAIKLGLEAAKSFGPNPSISKATQDALDLTMENGAKFSDELCSRLITMVTSRDGSVYVPQIWSVIILLLRKPRASLNGWASFRRWILVIQKCFNCSDTPTKTQALVAWDRLVYASQTNEPAGKDLTFLSKPIFLQLERRKDETFTPLIDRALSSYCNLLYYSFRPSASHERLDACWQEYISSPFQHRLNSNHSNMRFACRIFAELLWNPHPKVWVEGKVLETARFKPEDLLRLDCRWVRSRIAVILPIFESFFKNADWSDEAITGSPIGLAWIHMMKALSDASSKEIQPSSELMKAIAALLDMLQRVWRETQTSLNAKLTDKLDLFLSRFRFLLTNMISIITPFPFTDKLLLRTTQDTFQPAQTPTHRHQKDGITRAPILHLFNMILNSFPSAPTSEYYDLVNDLIRLAVSGHSSRSPRLEILRQFTEILEEAGTEIPQSISRVQDAWKAISTVTTECLKEAHMGTPNKRRDDISVGDFNKAVAILKVGNKLPGSLPEWIELFQSMISVVRTEGDDAAVSAAIDAISEDCNSASFLSIPRVVKLFEAIVFPGTHAAKQLPPFAQTITGPKDQNINSISCEKLLLLVTRALQDAYVKQKEFSKSDTLTLLEAVARCFDKCPPDFQSTLLEKLQNGLSVWITDAQGQYSATSGSDKCLAMAVRNIVLASFQSLRSSGSTDSQLLNQLTPMIASGFESRHKSIVNSFIREWNSTFGLQETLKYPARLEAALGKLGASTSIRLPGWQHEMELKESFPPHNFLSSPEESPNIDSPLGPMNRRDRIYKRPSSSPSLMVTPSSSKKDSRTKRRACSPKSSKTATPKSRLRHDSSQIQFVPVESSPSSNAVPETQLLTERQKDVRERQRLENASLFPGAPTAAISPKIPSAASKETHPDSDQFASEPLTPVIAAESGANEDDFTFSSPTPGSKEQSAQELTDFSLSAFEWSSSPNINAASASSRPQKTKTPKKPNQPSSKSSSATPHSQFRSGTVALGPTPPGNQNNVVEIQGNGACVQKGPTIAVDTFFHDPQESQESQSPSSDDPPVEKPIAKGPPGTNRRALPALLEARKDSAEQKKDVDLVPDSFSDQLEQQIASQLEQDLELSMDLELSDAKARVSTSAKKRKRDVADTRKDRTKRLTRGTGLSVEVGRCPGPDLSGFTSNSADQTALQESPGLTSEMQSTKSQRSRKSTRPSARKNQPKATNPGSPGSQTCPQRRSLRLRGRPATEDAEATSGCGGSEMDNVSKVERVAVFEQTGSEGGTGEDNIPQVKATPCEPLVENGPETLNVSVLASLRSVLDCIKGASFEKTFLREIDDVMFDIKMEAHEAVRRHAG
ncbi:uncharacterized protein CIMG_08307 [Coccidioides immitis RS]|uniref:uncharacterized protein n=1 Tax=Coccidioides immitis (strain RS) TaxID=246410 RepID=UPI00027D1608|nr:uncharacterized protein CIMG_08307 [Coccidioides immitis RS]EAS29561.3 hypothetical protein CIMG_08307 [Coccidioides immitis RS]